MSDRMADEIVRAFSDVALAWALSETEAAELIGGFDAIDERGTVSPEGLTRMQELVALRRALLAIHGTADRADLWVLEGKADPMFGTLTPLDYMLRGGLPAIRAVRTLAEAPECAGF